MTHRLSWFNVLKGKGWPHNPDVTPPAPPDPLPDPTPVPATPVITNVVVALIDPNSARVSWTTDQATTSQVKYGLGTGYGSVSLYDSALSTSHIVSISGLTPTTLYHFAVQSINAGNVTSTSSDYTFTTLSLQSAPVISNVQVSVVTQTSATISWSLDEYATGQIAYGLTSSYGSLTAKENSYLYNAHAQVINGLTPGTAYHFQVMSQGPTDNMAYSTDATFTTQALSGPVISGVSVVETLPTSVQIAWTTDTAADSQIDYGSTTAYGSTSTLDSALVTAHTHIAAGLATQTTYHFRVRSRDAQGTLTLGSDQTFTTPARITYYGSQLNGDDIANIVIGWNVLNDDMNRSASYRFRANHTGVLQAIRPFFIWSDARAGYALGNGGDIQIQVQTDDGTSNHHPTGTVLASMVYYSPVQGTNYYPLLTFPSPASLLDGQLYHLVFSNIAADPKANWVSLDCIWMTTRLGQKQPTLTDIDQDILEKNEAGNWIPYVRGSVGAITPCIEFDYADGNSQGQGYTGAYCYPDASFVNPKVISGTSGVREVFTVTGGTRTVTKCSVRVKPVSGSTALTVRVETSAGALVGEKTASGITTGGGDSGETWVTVTFDTPLTLTNGASYNLVLSTASDTVYATHSLFKSSAGGFKNTTYFGDGHAQYNIGGGWLNWNAWGVANRTDQDLQFYFTVSS